MKATSVQVFLPPWALDCLQCGKDEIVEVSMDGDDHSTAPELRAFTLLLQTRRLCSSRHCSMGCSETIRIGSALGTFTSVYSAAVTGVTVLME